MKIPSTAAPGGYPRSDRSIPTASSFDVTVKFVPRKGVLRSWLRQETGFSKPLSRKPAMTWASGENVPRSKRVTVCECERSTVWRPSRMTP